MRAVFTTGRKSPDGQHFFIGGHQFSARGKCVVQDTDEIPYATGNAIAVLRYHGVTQVELRGATRCPTCGQKWHRVKEGE